MIDVLNLALPYFGLIFLGFACGRYQGIPERGLAWMDFFIVYMSLPALFYRILARTPLEQLNNVRFILTTTLCTFLVLALSSASRSPSVATLPNLPSPRWPAPTATSATWGLDWRWRRLASRLPPLSH
jgi:hypothetical protein